MERLPLQTLENDGFATKFFRGLLPTFRYWMRTEVHVYAFSIAANVLLSFFPFLIVCVTVSRIQFDYQTTVAAIDFALHDYFPNIFSDFLQRNLPQLPHQQAPEAISILLLLFTANGIFEPLEVALNHAWGITKNRTFLRNQLVSLVLIFVCGGLELLTLLLTALNRRSIVGHPVEGFVAGFFLRLLALPMTAFLLFLVYRFLPNGRPPLNRVIPAAIGVGVLLEALKFLVALAWPWFDAKLQREYGVFRYSASLIFIAFFSSMVVLAGAEWAARGHQLVPADSPAGEGAD